MLKPRADNGIQVCRLPQMLGGFVMIDGPPRAGKSTVSNILGSFERVEIELIDEIYDYIGFLHGLGKIDRDAAIAIHRASADIKIYDLQLARNVNFRWRDHSSVFRSPKLFTYLKRFFSGEHDAAVDAIRRNRPILQQHAHYQLEHVNIHFDAHPETLRVIELLRHPLDLIPAQGHRLYWDSERQPVYNVQLMLRHDGAEVSILARGWEDEYRRLPPVDRFVRMLHGYQLRSHAVYRALPPQRRSRVLVVVFEDVIAHPFECAEQMAAFLHTRTTRATLRMIRKSGCPRLPDVGERDARLAELKHACAPETLRLLDEMISDYETGWAS